MKALVGVLILLCLFTAATVWQDRWLGFVRSVRDAARDDPHQPAPTRDSGGEWATVLIGGELEPVTIASEPANDPKTGRTNSNAQQSVDASPASARPESAPPIASARTKRAIVQRGQSLSTLCQAHYGTARQDLVEAVAKFNRLASPNQIREGQEILFPPVEHALGATPSAPPR